MKKKTLKPDPSQKNIPPPEPENSIPVGLISPIIAKDIISTILSNCDQILLEHYIDKMAQPYAIQSSIILIKDCAFMATTPYEPQKTENLSNLISNESVFLVLYNIF